MLSCERSSQYVNMLVVVLVQDFVKVMGVFEGERETSVKGEGRVG